MMTFECYTRCKIVFYQLKLRLHVANMVLMRKTEAYNTNMLVKQCALMNMFFRNLSGCALIGACALIRTNTVIALYRGHYRV